MNIFKVLYLRFIKGYWHMGSIDANIIKLHYMFREDKPEIIQIGKDSFLVSPPKKVHRYITCPDCNDDVLGFCLTCTGSGVIKVEEGEKHAIQR